jgi:glutamate N-acetyltransferase/amino-acid N-acetyltransferase
VALLVSDSPAAAAALFAASAARSATVVVSREHVAGRRLRAAVVNSGNANSATGVRGIEDARRMAALAAACVGCAPGEVFVQSTGVIGRFLPVDKIERALPGLALDRQGGARFARAIMTTDTVAKEFAATFSAGGARYTLGGCCKGAGMIHPQMATMLAFLTTDAPVEPRLLEGRLRQAVDRSFNMISVDGDASTNDSVLLLANGTAGGATITAADPGAVAALDEALLAVCTSLAKAIARDGEGATKLIEVAVTGAATLSSARAVARNITRSPLFKAAIGKDDPNWGRILMAAGYAGAPFHLDACRLWLGERLVFAHGLPTGVPEAEASAAIQGATARVRLDLGQGEAEATAWGCDLTEEYVRFNADYVT